MVNRFTPSINAKGLFDLKSPWTSQFGMTYTVEAIRSFDDLIKMGKDVFKTYYEPLGLIKKNDSNQDNPLAIDYDLEIDSDVHIVTLRDTDGRYVYVPDSFILGYPKEDVVPYKHMVLSVSLGALPDDYDLSAIQEELAELIMFRFGIQDPDVKAIVIQNDLYVSTEQHHALSEARQGAINTVYSVYNQNIELQNQVNELVTINTALTAVLDANDLLDSL